MSVRLLGNFLDVPPFWLQTRPTTPVGSGQASSNPVFGDHNENGLGLWDSLELTGSGSGQPIGGGFAKPNVINMPSPNNSSRNGAKVDTIVLHHTAGGGTAQDVGRYFQNRSAQVSANYTIGKDGAIVQSVQDDRAAWHAGVSEFKGRQGVNAFSIGIEIVNHGNGSDPYPQAQYEALAKLVLHLQERYGIPWERITGHKDVALPRGRKVDPSANFSYDKLKAEVRKLQGGNSAPAPQPQPQPPASVAPPNPGSSPGGTYTVKKNDSLSKIAKHVLGDMNRWREIYELNQDQIKNPNVIYPGQVLKLPGGQASKPEPKPEPKPAPKPEPKPAPAPAPAPTTSTDTLGKIQADIAALQGQLASIRTEIDTMIAGLPTTAPEVAKHLPRFLRS